MRVFLQGVESYDTSIPEVRAWLQTAVGAICAATPPVLVHCKRGRDRTGVVVAVCQLAAGVSEAEVIADYMASPEPEPKLFALTLSGIRKAGGPDKYLRRKADLNALRALLKPK